MRSKLLAPSNEVGFGRMFLAKLYSELSLSRFSQLSSKMLSSPALGALNIASELTCEPDLGECERLTVGNMNWMKESRNVTFGNGR